MLPQPIVLIVDDLSFIRTTLRKMILLEHPTARIIDAEGIVAARLVLKQTTITGIISDHYLRDSNGLQLLSTARSNNRNLPFIMMSGSRHLALSALKAGANDFLGKPLNLPEVQRALQKLVCETPGQLAVGA